MKASIGFYAHPNGRYTKVHVVKDGKPICNSRISEGMIFQWCAHFSSRFTDGSGVLHKYVECEHCKRKMRNVR